jgi:hypothetical protein
MDRGIESIFRTARFEPNPEFVDALERRLISDVPASRRTAGTLRAAVALTAGLALTLAVLALTGLLPLGLGATDRGEARQDCQRVDVVRPERHPALTVDAGGKLRVRDAVTPVRRSVQRCRPARGSTPREAGAGSATRSGTRSSR